MSKTSIVASTTTPDNVTVVLMTAKGLKNYNVTTGHPNFNKIREQVLNDEPEGLETLIDVAQSINNWGKSKAIQGLSQGRVTVEHGKIKYAGQTLHNSLTKRILKMVSEGQDSLPLIKFLDNVQCNPMESAKEELFDFLDGNQLPITKDGKFLAYKRVKNNFKDIYTGTMDNSPGAVVQVERDSVDTNRNNTCSRGLHFASLEYARDHYGYNGNGDRMLVVEIDPADVVSIPTDYNRQKGRTWKYKVLGELNMDTLKNTDVLESKSVVDLSNVDFSDLDWGMEEARKAFLDFLYGMPTYASKDVMDFANQTKKQVSQPRRDSRGRFIR